MASVCVLFLVLLSAVHVCVGHNAGVETVGFVHTAMAIQAVNLTVTSTITVNTTILSQSGQWISVSYATTDKPNNVTDNIQVFSPANVDFTKQAPIKYKAASKDPMYMQTGKGSTTFRLVNMRNDYIIAFVRNKTVVGVSQIISFANYNEPLQAHLALTNDPSQMRLMWVSNNTVNPQIKWSTTPQKSITGYQFTAQAASTSYTAKQMCGSTANSTGWMDPGQIHNGILTNLSPRRQYYYVYGDNTLGWSTEKTFTSPPSVGPNTQINIFAFGDMGKGEIDGSTCHWEEVEALNTTANMARELSEQLYDAVFHIGDISYAVGYASQWDAFFDSIESLATRVPWMVCPGNHEIDYYANTWIPVGDSYGECGVPYFNRFYMPPNNQPWYSVELGPVHFLLMSTEHDFTIGSAQNKWIQQDLASVDRAKTPWIILSGHRPMYISSTYNTPPGGDGTIAKLLIQHVEPYTFKYGVDVAWWGHNHSYQRSCPAFNNTCTTGGTVHVVIGMAGYSLTHNAQKPPPSWLVAYNDQDFGYTTLSISKTQLTMKFFDETRTVKDSFSLRARN